jgi:aryl-alcohol dehydrogenase
MAEGGVDYVLEITGSPEMYKVAVEILNPHGIVATFAGGSAAGYLPGGRKEISIIQGDAVPQRFIPKLIKLYREGRFPFDRLVKFYNFAAINRAMEDLRKGRTVKPVLRLDNLGSG